MKTHAIFSKELSLKGIQNQELRTFHIACKRYGVGWCLDGTPISVHPITGGIFKLGKPFLVSFLKEQYVKAHEDPETKDTFSERFEGSNLRRLVDLYIGMIQDAVKRSYSKDHNKTFFMFVEYDEKKSYTGD